jgi:hypothetical protein
MTFKFTFGGGGGGKLTDGLRDPDVCKEKNCSIFF